jgi:glucose-like phosphotransferase system IIB component
VKEMSTIMQYTIILIALVLISLVVAKLMKRDFSIEANKLINYLGGKDNIINAECNMSRFKVVLKDVSIVDKDAIQKLGAKGIVEIDNQLKIIFGKDARQLKKYIDDIL